MKIYNTDNTTNSCPTTNTVILTNPSIPTLTNVAIIPDNTQTGNVACTERCQNLGRFRTLGVANIDPKQSYVCGSTTLKVCGNLEVCDDLTVNGNLTVIGGTTINNLTIVNLTVTGDLVACDISACNIDISQNLTVGGDTTLVDVSATNVDISQNLTVLGDTTLVDVSANIIQYTNNSQFFNWGVHIIPISGVAFQLGMITRYFQGAPLISNVSFKWGMGGVDEREGGWIYPGYGGYGSLDRNTNPQMLAWSDRSSFPTDGLQNDLSDPLKYAYSIGVSIPFDGSLTKGLSRFSWMLGKYSATQPPPPVGFTLSIAIYLIKCDHGGPILQDPPLATIEITRKCGHTTWGVGGNGVGWSFPGPVPAQIAAGDAIGIYIIKNPSQGGAGVIHSPATFTLEVQRDV